MHYISGDIEGCSGFGCEDGANGGILQAHLAAVVEGMRDAGEDAIRLRTWHGRPELPDCVEIVHSDRTEDFDLPGLTSECAGLAMIGFHGLWPDHAFGHSYRFPYMLLNDRKIGEIAIQVLLAATRGVPTVLLAGSAGAVDEVKPWAPDALTVTTRPGKAGDEGPMDARVLDVIRRGAAEVVRRKGQIAVPTIPERFVFEVPFREMRAA